MVKEPEGISVRSSGVNNPDYNLIYLSDILDVFFTKKDGLTITKNEKVESLFHARYGYGNVSHETIKCKFYFKPTGFNNLKDNPSTEFYEKTDFNTMEISKEDFYSFLTENRNDFDNTENCKAQSVSCSSVSIF